MLATGGSVSRAIELVLEQGVPQENVIVVNVIASETAVNLLSGRFPKLGLVTAAIDTNLTPERCARISLCRGTDGG